MRGWTAALLLAEVNPAAANAIFARGWMYGESRVIVGAHWQSDVDASRVAASIGYSALHGSAEFRQQMDKARREYLKKTGKLSSDHSVKANASTLTGKANRLDNIKATDASRGTISKDKKKTKKK
jgi:acid phosphatase (class A)